MRDHRELDLTVLGSTTSLANLRAPGFARNPAAFPPGTDNAQVGLHAVVETWAQSYTLASGARTGAELVIEPWLCRTIPEAELAANSNSTVKERRTIELDDVGRFWTNGRLGFGFPAQCDWFSTASYGTTVAARQDGPSLCSDANRRSTNVELEDASGQVVGHPQVCVAALSGDGVHRSVRLNLLREDVDGSALAFAVGIVHCFDSGQSFPFAVSSGEFLSSDCVGGGAKLFIGKAADRQEFDVAGGAWMIESLSEARDGRHVSDLDLTFVGHGESYRLHGVVDLPEVFE